MEFFTVCDKSNIVVKKKGKTETNPYIFKVTSAKVNPRHSGNICSFCFLEGDVQGDITGDKTKEKLKVLARMAIDFSKAELDSFSEQQLADYISDTPDYIVLPVYLSKNKECVGLSTTPPLFNNKGLIGWAIRKYSIRGEKSMALCREEMMVEIEEYEQYLNGECYTLSLCDIETGEEVEKYDRVFYGSYPYFNGMYNFIKSLGYSVCHAIPEGGTA